MDKNLSWQHLWDWNPSLSEDRTPDWVLYCEAAFGGFNALVTRDFTQAEQAEEMVCLSHLEDFHVISWRKRMDDPVAEWGQLLAYLPLIRRYIGEHDSRVIFLPTPVLATDKTVHNPKEFISRIAVSQGQSVRQVRSQASRSMVSWEQEAGRPGRYTARLGIS